MKSKTRNKEEVDIALMQIEKIYAQHVMSDAIYYKCLVSLAYEYICANEHQEGLVQISRVPVSYYQDVQLQHMREDKSYAELVVLLSYRLIQMGVVEGSENLHVPTMAPARA